MVRRFIAASLTLTALSLATTMALAEPSAAPAATTTSEKTPTPYHSSIDRSYVDVAPLAFMPVGSLAQSGGPGVGGAIGVEHAVTGRVSITGRVAAIQGVPTTLSLPGLTIASTMSELPMLAGVKIYLAQDLRGFYLAPELGMVFVSTDVSVSGNATMTQNNSGLNVGSAASVGYKFGPIDVRTSLLALDVAHANSSLAMMGSLAYSFGF